MRRLSLILFLMLSITLGAQTRHYGVKDGLLNNQIRQLISMPNHQMMVVTDGAFSLFNGQRFIEQFCCMDSVMELPSFGIYDYRWQGDSILWLKDFYHLYIYNVKERRFQYDYSGRLREASVKAFLSANNDSVKTAQKQLVTLHWEPFTAILAETRFHGDNWLHTYCKDWQGGEWFGTESNGIIYHSPTKPAASIMSFNLEDDVNFPTTTGGGELLLAGAKGIYRGFTGTLIPGSQDATCTNVHPDNKGGVWISSTQGLYYYDGRELQTYSPDNSTGFVHCQMRFALPLPDGRLLVGNLLHHLGYYNLTTHHFDCLNDRLPALNDYRILIDAFPYDNKGKVLIITQNGAFLLDTHTDKLSPVPGAEGISRTTNKYNCALRDSKGCIWLGTQNGLYRIVPQMNSNGVVDGHTLLSITTTDGLSNNCIRSIVEDAFGQIWVATSYGINCLFARKNTLHITTFLEDDGVPAVEMAERGACALADGRVLFSCSKGIVSIDSRVITRKPQSLTVTTMSIVAAGKAMSFTQKHFELSYDEFPLHLEFSALNYESSKHTHYRYRLNDQEWQLDNTGAGLASINYNTLNSGDYTFEIQAKMDDGDWGPTCSYTFTVSPPWWWSWWAIMLYALISGTIIGVVIFYYIKYRRRQMERENEEKVNHLFELQNEARYNFAQKVNVEQSKLEEQNSQPWLAERMTQCIADNMDNYDYTVDILARDMGMSRASLYKKSQEILGVTPNDFMRNVRLKHSITLLEKGIPINQVSLMVGFQTPYYFSKCFKNLFGVSPSKFNNE